MVHEIYIRICLKSPKNGEREKKKLIMSNWEFISEKV